MLNYRTLTNFSIKHTAHRRHILSYTFAAVRVRSSGLLLRSNCSVRPIGGCPCMKLQLSYFIPDRAHSPASTAPPHGPLRVSLACRAMDAPARSRPSIAKAYYVRGRTEHRIAAIAQCGSTCARGSSATFWLALCALCAKRVGSVLRGMVLTCSDS